ncbi:reverse transcriptase domain-containing protein [Tanacetum coccineum]|uniref:Reverse transcriptase domain-containing protein n=1 Tax=Tanacetum coccineum TaxID=301880 RepID=A0ABQ4WRU7_9ASTR
MKKGDFRWTTKAEEAFTQLKQHIAALPTLVAPRPGEELIMYLSAMHGAISAVLLTDRNSVTKKHRYIRVTSGTVIKLCTLEKLILSIHEQRRRNKKPYLRGLRIAARNGEDNMVQYLDKTKSLIQAFDDSTIRQVPEVKTKKRMP